MSKTKDLELFKSRLKQDIDKRHGIVTVDVKPKFRPEEVSFIKVVLHLKNVKTGEYFLEEFKIQETMSEFEAEHIAKMKVQKRRNMMVMATCCAVKSWKEIRDR